MCFRSLGLVIACTVVLCCWGQRDPAPCGEEADIDLDYGRGDTSCHISSQTLYPYVVRIWNLDWRNTSAHGALVSHRSVLTVCAPFVKNDEATNTTVLLSFAPLEVYAQKMRREHDPDWSPDGDNTCYQSRKVFNIFPHDKCLPHRDSDVYFNLAMVILDKSFVTARQFSYPTMHIPTTLYAAVYYIFLVNVQKSSGCEVPLFYYHAHPRPTFANDMRVVSLRWVTECIPRLCELDPFYYVPNRFRYPGQWPSLHQGADRKWQLEQRNITVKRCLAKLTKLMNFTELCVYFPKSPLIKLGHQFMDIKSHLWTGGAPLVCNGTGIGIVTDAKDRSRMMTFRHDFYQVTTYIRTWYWVVDKRPKFGQRFLERNDIEVGMQDARPRVPLPRKTIDPEVKSRSTRGQLSVTSVRSILPSIFVIAITRLTLPA